MDNNNVWHESICLKLTIENSFGSPIALLSNAYVPNCCIRITHSTIYILSFSVCKKAVAWLWHGYTRLTDRIVMSNFLHDVRFFTARDNSLQHGKIYPLC